MRLFLARILQFALICCLLGACIAGINNAIINSNLNSLEEHEIAVIGDSHIHRGLSTSVLGNSVSWTKPAEPYTLTYLKFKKIADHVKPKLLLIGFSYHNISAFNDKKYSNSHADEMFKRTYPLVFLDKIEGVEYSYSDYTKVLLRYMVIYPSADHLHFLGEDGSLTNSNTALDSNYLNKVIDRHFFYGDEEENVSEVSIENLKNLIDLSINKGVQPILVGTPLHAAYLDLIPSKFKRSFDSLKTDFDSRGIIVIDKTNSNYPDSLFKDYDHLNTEGAVKFSKQIRASLQELL
jgi:hypothetical protein